MHCVYVLKNEKKNRWYIGYTADLQQRVRQHKQLHPRYKLVYYEIYTDKRKAVNREKKLKHYGSAWRALRDRLQA
ncbi:MAG: GIY-YIG nuclease family protein [Candidatus Colwellbacteria bacterium]|nr:GIY-YIG nuclease family protein [Candidatus Colwellbacteria bacterium]